MSLALLTGATGTVGAALLERMLREGRHVRCLVRDARQLPSHPNVEAVIGSIDDAAAVERAVSGCSTVFHLAGVPQQWTNDPSIYTRANVDGTRVLLAAAQRQGVARFLYAGTQDTLDLSRNPFDESTRNRDPHPSPYERSKIEAQRLVDAAAAQGLHTGSLHLVAVFGPAPARIGGVNKLLYGLLKGSVPMLPPGGVPLLYDRDAADAFLRAEASAAPGSHYLASTAWVSVDELARKIARIAGGKVPASMPLAAARLFATVGDLAARVTRRAPQLSRVDLRAFRNPGRPSTARLRDELGWLPTDLDTALRETIEAWHVRERL